MKVDQNLPVFYIAMSIYNIVLVIIAKILIKFTTAQGLHIPQILNILVIIIAKILIKIYNNTRFTNNKVGMKDKALH